MGFLVVCRRILVNTPYIFQGVDLERFRTAEVTFKVTHHWWRRSYF